MSFQAQGQGFDAPSSANSPVDQQIHENILKYDSSAYALIDRLLRQEQQSNHYQSQLESRIYSDAAEYHKLRAHSQQLERLVIAIQHQRSQLESSVTYTTEACRVACQNLELERNKVQQLESRLNDLQPGIASLLQKLGEQEANNKWPNGKEKDNGMALENQYQRELITHLQSTLYARDRTVEELKETLDRKVSEEQTANVNEAEEDITTNELHDCSSEGSCIEIVI
ncbi:uncharacterized protein N7484_000265 [Penicillium longicatenatum]|uniref:uncharacterized protein n=1 Tax=Penicillium longicatenatum TaxID=1561947 RepID=UPI002548BF59|nr:uncharacterized protein N7484_000265 [Penicillium longicatenatum]KAJ5660893.1 hypothetical protein N7484_000265 [Penicillium longicatenatum]